MTHVLITIDTEFSAGGCFDHPRRSGPITDQAVFCRINGRSRGLGFLLATFARFHIKATFFVEAAHTLMLGFEPMRPAVEAILQAGHDVQLHIHPMWLDPPAGTDPRVARNDSVADLDDASCAHVIDAGLVAFAAWGAPRPIAFRAGNLQMGRGTYRVLREREIPISSSIGVAIDRPRESELWIESGNKVIDGIIEIPVLAYSDLDLGGRRHMRNLTVTGCGSGETLELLRAAQASGLADIVLLTHPFEFIKKWDDGYARIRRNRINQRRLIALCEALAHSSDLFSTATFAERACEWLRDRVPSKEIHLRVPLLAAATRIVENKVNDYIWWV